jgi:hypothetical protein
VHDHLPAVPLKLHPAMRQLLKPIFSSKMEICGNRIWLQFIEENPRHRSRSVGHAREKLKKKIGRLEVPWLLKYVTLQQVLYYREVLVVLLLGSGTSSSTVLQR